MTPKPTVVRGFNIPKDKNTNEEITIKLAEPALVAEGLYLQTWASSEVLARQIRHIDITFPQDSPSTIPVVELGAGTGLVGIAAACIWRKPVVLTELAPIVPGLAENIAVNGDVLAQGAAPVLCGTLDWAQPTVLELEKDASGKSAPDYGRADKAHVLIASDTIYSEDHPEMLADVIVQWLSKDPEARAIIGYAMRVSYLDYIRDLWERLENAGLEAVQEGRDNADSKMFDDECLIEWCVWRWKKT